MSASGRGIRRLKICTIGCRRPPTIDATNTQPSTRVLAASRVTPANASTITTTTSATERVVSRSSARSAIAGHGTDAC